MNFLYNDYIYSYNILFIVVVMTEFVLYETICNYLHLSIYKFDINMSHA